MNWVEKETEAWCATEDDGSDEIIPDQMGVCEQACQPTKLPEVAKHSSTISIVIISITIMILLTSIITIYYWYVKRNEGKEEKDTIQDENIEKSSTDHQMLEVTNGSNPIEMESMAHTNRTELVLERQTSMMNEYTEESKIILEMQTSTIEDGDPSEINPDTFLNEQASLLPYTL